MVSLIETPTRLLVTGTPDEMSVLRERFRYHPNRYFASDAYQMWKTSGGERGWDGYRYPLALKTETGGEILRGRKDEVIAACRQLGFKLNTERCLTSVFAGVTCDAITDDLIQASFTLDANQREAIVKWLQHGIGINHMSVNSGKTATFAAAAAYIKRKFPEARFLYFTFTERLVRQVMDGMRNFLPAWNITQYGGGGSKDKSGKDMVVATQAMLNRNFKQLVAEGFFKTFHALLLDESHHCQSPTCERVLRECAAFYRLAASDSLKESDPDMHNRIKGFCGPVRWTVTSGTLIEQGRSAAPHIYLIDVPSWKNTCRHYPNTPDLRSPAWTYKDNRWHKATYLGPVQALDSNNKPKFEIKRRFEDGGWIKEKVPVTVPGLHLLSVNGVRYESPSRWTLLERRYDKAIIRFKERNNMICAWAKYFSEKGWPTVVVATRTPHVMTLEALLAEALGDKVRSLSGEASTPARNEAFEWLKTEPGAVLITPLIREGVSINEIRAGIIADPIADFEVAKQVIGRFMRRKEENNTCHVAWFIDSQNPLYVRNARDVMRRLEKIDGLTFYHPVAGPETIKSALVSKGRL